jgi:hypothetical protein
MSDTAETLAPPALPSFTVSEIPDLVKDQGFQALPEDRRTYLLHHALSTAYDEASQSPDFKADDMEGFNQLATLAAKKANVKRTAAVGWNAITGENGEPVAHYQARHRSDGQTDLLVRNQATDTNAAESHLLRIPTVTPEEAQAEIDKHAKLADEAKSKGDAAAKFEQENGLEAGGVTSPLYRQDEQAARLRLNTLGNTAQQAQQVLMQERATEALKKSPIADKIGQGKGYGWNLLTHAFGNAATVGPTLMAGFSDAIGASGTRDYYKQGIQNIHDTFPGDTRGSFKGGLNAFLQFVAGTAGDLAPIAGSFPLAPYVMGAHAAAGADLRSLQLAEQKQQQAQQLRATGKADNLRMAEQLEAEAKTIRDYRGLHAAGTGLVMGAGGKLIPQAAKGAGILMGAARGAGEMTALTGVTGQIFDPMLYGEDQRMEGIDTLKQAAFGAAFGGFHGIFNRKLPSTEANTSATGDTVLGEADAGSTPAAGTSLTPVEQPPVPHGTTNVPQAPTPQQLLARSNPVYQKFQAMHDAGQPVAPSTIELFGLDRSKELPPTADATAPPEATPAGAPQGNTGGSTFDQTSPQSGGGNGNSQAASAAGNQHVTPTGTAMKNADVKARFENLGLPEPEAVSRRPREVVQEQANLLIQDPNYAPNRLVTLENNPALAYTDVDTLVMQRYEDQLKEYHDRTGDPAALDTIKRIGKLNRRGGTEASYALLSRKAELADEGPRLSKVLADAELAKGVPLTPAEEKSIVDVINAPDPVSAETIRQLQEQLKALASGKVSNPMVSTGMAVTKARAKPGVYIQGIIARARTLGAALQAENTQRTGTPGGKPTTKSKSTLEKRTPADQRAHDHAISESEAFVQDSGILDQIPIGKTEIPTDWRTKPEWDWIREHLDSAGKLPTWLKRHFEFGTETTVKGAVENLTTDEGAVDVGLQGQQIASLLQQAETMRENAYKHFYNQALEAEKADGPEAPEMPIEDGEHPFSKNPLAPNPKTLELPPRKPSANTYESTDPKTLAEINADFGRHGYSPIEIVSKASFPRWEATLPARIAKALGLRLELFRGGRHGTGSLIEGTIDGKTRTVFLNVATLNQGMPRVVVHEALHVLAEVAPQYYDTLLARLEGKLKTPEFKDWLRNRGYQDHQLTEEMAAHLAGEFALEEGFWKHLFGDRPSLGMEILTALQTLLKKLLAVLTRKEINDAAHSGAKDFIKDRATIAEIQKHFAEALRGLREKEATIKNSLTVGKGKFSYAGPNAKLSEQMRNGLETAKAMAAGGKTAEEIRAVTGWFPGKYDGKMRFEVPDENARFLPATKQWEKGKDQWAANLEEVIDHPDLFKAYPEARTIRVSRLASSDNTRGSYQGNRIVLNALNGNLQNFSTLMHEIQHWIQAKEGFARGANPQQYADAQSVTDANVLANKIKSGLLPSEAAQWMQETLGRKPSIQSLDLATGDPTKLRLLNGGPQEAYKRTAGEIESRDVQARQSFTPEQRQATAPYSSENIAPEDAIVLNQNKGRAFSIDPTANKPDPRYVEYFAAYLLKGKTPEQVRQLFKSEFNGRMNAQMDAIQEAAHTLIEDAIAKEAALRSPAHLLTQEPKPEPGAEIDHDLAKKLAKAHLEEAWNEGDHLNENELTERVKESLDAHYGRDLPTREVREAWTNYKEAEQPTPDEVVKHYQELRTQSREHIKLQRLTEQLKLIKTGVLRDKPSAEVRRLREEVSALKHKLNYQPKDPAVELASRRTRVINALSNQIETLQKVLNGLMAYKEQLRNVFKADTVIHNLREELAKLRTAAKEMYDTGRSAREEAATIDAAERATQDYENKTALNQLPVSNKVFGPISADVKAALEARDKAKAAYQDMIAKDPRTKAEKLQAAMDALDEQISKAVADLAAGRNTKPGQPRKPIDPALQSRVSDLMKLRAQLKADPRMRQAKTLDSLNKAIEKEQNGTAGQPKLASLPDTLPVQLARTRLYVLRQVRKNSPAGQAKAEAQYQAQRAKQLAKANAELDAKITQAKAGTIPAKKAKAQRELNDANAKALEARQKKKAEIDLLIERLEEKQKSIGVRYSHIASAIIRRWIHAAVLSNPGVVLHLGLVGNIIGPIEFAIKQTLGRFVLKYGMPDIFEASTMEGLSATDLKDTFIQGMINGWKQAGKSFREGKLTEQQSNMAVERAVRAVHGGKWWHNLDHKLTAHVHAMIKNPLWLAYYESGVKSAMQASEWTKKDLNDPRVMADIHKEAATWADQSILMEKNFVADGWNGILSSLDKTDSVLAHRIADLMYVSAPIMKISLNFIFRQYRQTFGILQAYAMRAELRKQIARNKFTPEQLRAETNRIARTFKEGTAGVAQIAVLSLLITMSALMAPNAVQVGTAYLPGETPEKRRKTGKLQPGEWAIMGVKLPEFVMRYPAAKATEKVIGAYRGFNHARDTGSSILGSTGSTAWDHAMEFMREAPILQGPASLADLSSATAWKAEAAQERMTAKFVPTLLGRIADVQDNPHSQGLGDIGSFFNLEHADVTKRKINGVGDALLSRIPHVWGLPPSMSRFALPVKPKK